MPEVFYNEQDIVCVGPQWVEQLKAAAAASPLRRARLRLHLDNADAVQEMIIALCRDVLFRPHRHEAKSESFHMIEGDLHVLVFDDEGRVTRNVHMGPPGSGRHYCYRLCRPAWHAIVPKSEFVVFHETTMGPFRQGAAAQFAPWAPAEGEALRQFLETSLRAGLERPARELVR
jgi:cupin fold WbuC family metalloprotein